jgi:hypothetical protein
MSEDKAKLTGPDLTKGVALSTIREGIMLLGTRTVSRRFSHGAVTKSSQSAPLLGPPSPR